MFIGFPLGGLLSLAIAGSAAVLYLPVGNLGFGQPIHPAQDSVVRRI